MENLIKFELYHGSEKVRAMGFISNQKMDESKGDKHWLGDGFYFYEDLFFAYRWIANMFKNKIPKGQSESFKELSSKYMILKAYILVDSTRIFDIDGNFQNKLIFNRFKENIESKKEFSDRITECKIHDGVVLNVMFNEYGYKNCYDIVIAQFIDKVKNDNKSRVAQILEKQICIKNPNVIREIQKMDFEDRYEEFNKDLKEFNQYNQCNIYFNKRKKRMLLK